MTESSPFAQTPDASRAETQYDSPRVEVVYFIVLVGVLITVHELGHFVCAKFFGVRVLRLSLGFGPRIAGFTRGGTEYMIAAFPLGGYVRMLGESPLDRVREEDESASFSQQPLYKRAAIVIAGPAMNLLLPLVLFFVVFMGDDQMTPSVIGTVFPDRPADGLLEPGDRAQRVDDEEVQTFYELARAVGERPDQTVEIVVERDGETHTVSVVPFAARSRRLLDRVEVTGRIGIKPHHPVAIVGVTSPSSPAAAAQLRSFDRIIEAGRRPVVRWIDLEAALEGNRGAMVPVTYLRPTRVAGALGGFAELDIYEAHVATLTPEPGPGDALPRAGLEPIDPYVSHVTAPSPSDDAAGLRPADRLVELDGQPIRLWATLVEDIEAAPDRAHTLSWRRADQLITRDYRLRATRSVSGDAADQRIDVLEPRSERHLATLGHWQPTVLDPPIETPNRVSYALHRAFELNRELVEVTVFTIVRMFQGRLSVRSAIGGPIRVYEATEAAAREGALIYLMLMALISINLGLINLLPIPMLDGGHLAFFVYEAIARKPASRRIREIASMVGLVFLVGVMVLAFTNDIERQWPRIVEAFESE